MLWCHPLLPGLLLLLVGSIQGLRNIGLVSVDVSLLAPDV